MILHQDGYLQLDYDPQTGVLYAPMPDMHPEELLRLHKALSIMVETIIAYNVNYVLLDASCSQTTVGEEECAVVLQQFVEELRKTHLRKLARIVSTNPMREEKAAQFIVTSHDLLPYAGQNFSSYGAALQWLERD